MYKITRRRKNDASLMIMYASIGTLNQLFCRDRDREREREKEEALYALVRGC